MMTKNRPHWLGKLKVLLILPVLFFVILAFAFPKNNAELIKLDGQKFSDINPIKETLLTEQDYFFAIKISSIDLM